MLAATLSADLFIILTGVDRVARDFGKPSESPLPEMDLELARAMLAQGQFPPGSMGPKVTACVRFVEQGGRLGAIASLDGALDAISGSRGTRVVPG